MGLLRRPSAIMATILIPLVTLALFLWPVALFLSLTPIFGIIALPSLLGLSLFLLYGLSFLPHLILGGDEQSATVSLPVSPIRAFLVARTLFRQIKPLLSLGLPQLFADACYRRLMLLGNQNASDIVLENVQYGPNMVHRLDIYSTSTGGAHAPAPVLVFIHGGMWTSTRKGFYLQLALRMRRLGYCVCIPDFTQYPKGSCQDAVADIRRVLVWVSNQASIMGGDPSRIFLMGHGSGSHLALLTLVQDAVVRSREDHYSDLDIGKLEVVDIPQGVRRLVLADSGPQVLPPVEGIILLSGVYDCVKQLRHEAATAWDKISTLRRAVGRTHAATLMASPAHLLHAAKPIIKLDHLPKKFLIVHGGQDKSVPLVQSLLVRTLLIEAGIEDIRFRAYRELGHLESLVALMGGPRGNKYLGLLCQEIREMSCH